MPRPYKENRMQKQWPVLAQILIGLGCVGGIFSLFAGVSYHHWLVAIMGLVSLSIFYFFYKLKSWAQIGVSVILSSIIIFDILAIISREIPLGVGIFVVLFRGSILYYFNSKKINELFEENPSS
jgi:hypothetical protein